jgi:hypothetical protein
MMMARRALKHIGNFDLNLDGRYFLADVAMAATTAGYSVVLQPYAAVSCCKQ